MRACRGPLAGAIFFEVIGTTMIKFNDGFTRPWPSAGVIFFYLISTVLMNIVVLRHVL
mgnify:CR=1 FL=1